MMEEFVAFCLVTLLMIGEVFFAVQNPVVFHEDLGICMNVATVTELKFRSRKITDTHRINCGCMVESEAVKLGLVPPRQETLWQPSATYLD